MAGLERYRALFSAPYVTVMTASALLARLPLGIIGLALVLFVREQTGSYASAGAVAAAFALGNAATAPYAGRLVDRRGPVGVLLGMSVVHAVAISAVVPLGYDDAPVVVLLGVSAVAGCAMPPISSVLRTMWPTLLQRREELLTTAFALDAVIVELVFVTGPAIVALLTALLAPAAALILSAVVTLGGTLMFATRAPTRARAAVPQTAGAGYFGALRSPGLLTLVLGLLPLGITLGATEVVLPAFSEAQGDRALAGILLTVWSLGSAVGGLAYGAGSWALPLADRFVRFALILPFTLIPLALAPSLAVMLVLLFPAGAVIAPTLAAGNQLVGDVTPPGQQTEAYTWPLTALILGVATGNAVAGIVVDLAGWRTAFLVAALAGLASGAVLLTRRATLRPLAVAT